MLTSGGWSGNQDDSRSGSPARVTAGLAVGMAVGRLKIGFKGTWPN